MNNEKENKKETEKEKTIYEVHKLMEIYKAGFTDGYSSAKKRRIVWKTIYKKCAKSWNKRFLNNPMKPKSI